jgi:CheY-like chemotaxis protein
MADAKTILIVEDDPILRDLYKDRLELEGYKIMTAPDGQEGLEAVKEKIPDLILLDIMMPKMNGFDVLDRLKADDETKHIPVFMLSALVQEENVVKAKQKGATGYLIKSNTTPGQIVDKVKETLK